MSTTEVSPTRVAQCLLRARDLFGPTGRFWIKGELMREDDRKPGMYDYCAAGAIQNVEGFTVAEKNAAKIALAELIAKTEGLDDYRDDFGDDLVWAEEGVIFEANDNVNTTFNDVRNWFTSAAARLKRR